MNVYDLDVTNLDVSMNVTVTVRLSLRLRLALALITLGARLGRFAMHIDVQGKHND